VVIYKYDSFQLLINIYYIYNRVKNPFLLTNKEINMKEVITMVKGYVDDIAHLMISFVAIGAISEVIFGTGVFGVNVIGNLTSIISTFGQSGFAGLVALLVLVGLFRK